MIGDVRVFRVVGTYVSLRAEADGVVWFIVKIVNSPVEIKEARWRLCV